MEYKRIQTVQQSQVVLTLISNICIISSPFSVQDIQAEIDAHNDIFKSIDGNRQKMVKALGNSEEATMLQHRLDDMNQRWNDLKAKSASIRSVMSVSKITRGQDFHDFCISGREQEALPLSSAFVSCSCLQVCISHFKLSNANDVTSAW